MNIASIIESAHDILLVELAFLYRYLMVVVWVVIRDCDNFDTISVVYIEGPIPIAEDTSRETLQGMCAQTYERELTDCERACGTVGILWCVNCV